MRYAGRAGLRQRHLSHVRIPGLLRQEQHAPASADVHRFPGRTDGRHQRREAIAPDPIDHHQPQVGLLRPDQRLVRIARGAVDDQQVRPLARPDRPQRVLPLQDCRRVAGGHRDQVLRAERPAKQVLRVQPGHLQLAEQVLAARRRPVAAQADAHPGRPGGIDPRRRTVQQQVAQRRPDHRSAVAAEHFVVLGQQPGGVDAGEAVVQCPLVRGDLQRQEVAPGDRTCLAVSCDAFAQVQQEAAVLLGEAAEERPRVLGVDVGDAPWASARSGSSVCSTLRTMPR